MLTFLTNFLFFSNKKQKTPKRKILLTLFFLFLFRFGNMIPLTGINQEAIKKSFLQIEKRNSFLTILNLYSGGKEIPLLTPFSLGILPYINASILIDLGMAFFPSLEKLQSEEGHMGRQKLNFYKKIVTLIFAIFQSIFFIFYLKSYFYENTFFSYFSIALELVTGCFLIVWLSSLIDNEGIGNGTSLMIFTNIIMTLISKNFFNIEKLSLKLGFEILIFFFLMVLICISQSARIYIEVVSARQLIYIKNIENCPLRNYMKESFQKKENALSIRLNQAGIFPIIITSNLLSFFSIFSEILGKQYLFLNSFLYYLLIIAFNYFYTTVFWNPKKISEQLRKASVSIKNVTPGKETTEYLENVVRSTSLLGGIFLCFILIAYDIIKSSVGGIILPQFNLPSLIILVGIAYDVQRTLQSFYKNSLEEKKIN